MNRLNIPFLATADSMSPLSQVSDLMNTLEKQAIDIVPWSAYTYQPAVYFTIAHGFDCLFIKYFVSEKNIRAQHRQINSPVHTDTCVEFFIGLGTEPSYYNFEFNCMGTCQAGYGTGKNGRELLPINAINNIKYQPFLKHHHSADNVYWELTLIIPFDVFCHHHIASLADTICRMNFFKCGDELPVPHYLTWNRIISGEPNFHLPQFFGEGYFSNQTF